MKTDWVIIGTGRLAKQLVIRLAGSSAWSLKIAGRDERAAQEIAASYDHVEVIALNEIPENSRCILCVSDDAIPAIAAQVGPYARLLVHLAGSVPLTAISTYAANSAVVWPLQSFTPNQEVDWSKIPLIVEHHGSESEDLITDFLDALGGPQFPLDFESRRKLHLSAVIVNNFSNHLFRLAYDWCLQSGLPFEALLPLIQETADRLHRGIPEEFQTGPAWRGDQATIDAHLSLLAEQADLAKLYATLTESIKAYRKP